MKFRNQLPVFFVGGLLPFVDVFERVDAGADVEGLQAAVLAQQDVRAAPEKDWERPLESADCKRASFGILTLFSKKNFSWKSSRASRHFARPRRFRCAVKRAADRYH